MPNWSGSMLTTKGQALQAKVDAGTTTLALTKMKIGSGTLADGQSIASLTDLISPQQNVGISAISAADNITTVTGVITNTGLTTGFYVRELGLFATDPTEGEILYSMIIDSAPDYLPPEGDSVTVSEEFAYNIIVSNAASVTATINQAGLVTASILAAHNTDANAHTAAFAIHNAATDAHADLLHLRKNSTAYVVGDVKRSPTLPSYAYIECTIAGTTAATEPTWPDVGSTVTDGGVTWIVRDLRVADAQFDASTKIATTSFVQRALGNNQGWKTISADTVLTGADAGKVIGISSNTTSDITITLPAASSVPIGAVFKFASNSTAKTITIKTSGSDTITAGYQNGSYVPVTSISMTGLQATAELACATTDGWFLVSGTSQLKASEYFKCSLGSNGYQKLPSGLILQWGMITPSTINTQTQFTFPIAFPTGGLVLIAAAYSGGTTFVGAQGYVVNATTGSVMNTATSTVVCWLAIGK